MLPHLPSITCRTDLFPQLRRQSRERREYIFKKSHEAQERSVFERKQRIKDLVAQGKQLPTELRNDARTIGKDLVLDEAQTGEYRAAKAGSTPNSPLTHLACRPPLARRRRVRKGRHIRPQGRAHHVARPLVASPPVLQGKLAAGKARKLQLTAYRKCASCSPTPSASTAVTLS